MFWIWVIFFEKFERFALKCSNFVNFWARKMFFFFKQVRISPEIDWYHYQSANAAPTGIVRHRIETDKFSRSVTSEPNVPPPSFSGKFHYFFPNWVWPESIFFPIYFFFFACFVRILTLSMTLNWLTVQWKHKQSLKTLNQWLKKRKNAKIHDFFMYFWPIFFPK